MLKAKSSENFLSPKICKILTFYGAWKSGGMKSSNIFTAKGTSLRESMSFEPFFVKIRWGRGLIPRAVREKSLGLP